MGQITPGIFVITVSLLLSPDMNTLEIVEIDPWR